MFFIVTCVFCLQTYRDLKEITPETMQMVKRNFEWVADKVEVRNGCYRYIVFVQL